MNKTFVVSDESTNSYGFNVLTDGIDLSRFEKNPIMFYQHDSQKVIGKWENVRKEGNQLLADAVFDTESELGKEVSRKVEQGFLKATSLGISFQRTDLSSDNKLSKCLLHEISIVSIGSNHNALKLYNDDSEFISLAFGSILEQNELGKILNLSEPTQANILEATKLLLAEKTELLNFQNSVNQERKELATDLVDYCILRKVIPENLREIQLKQFEEDYEKAWKTLSNSALDTYPFKGKMNFFALLKQEQRKQGKEYETEKPKSLWDLEDYRRFAPEELEANPQFYRELAEKYFNNNQ